MRKRAFAIACMLGLPGTSALSSTEFDGKLQQLANSTLLEIARDPAVVRAILDQNIRTAAISQAEIDTQDAKWQAEVGKSDQPMIAALLAAPLSQTLSEQVEANKGLVTEILVMDARGLTVAESSVTSDYWQGDEDKWRETYLKGPGALDISEIDFDDSTQTYQSQVSMTVSDPDTGAAIGAISVGIDVTLLH